MNIGKNYQLLFTILLTFVSIQSSYAQNTFKYQHYTTEDGLPHNICYNMLQDSKGYMWFGTDDGMARFDGSEFKTFRTQDGLLSNYIIGLTEAEDSTIWLATWVAKYVL